jgi:hypothetical protein
MNLGATRCLACEDNLDGSVEHAFPQALGGTKKSTRLYCGSCNVRLGHELDEPLAVDFEYVTNLLAVRRDRGPAPTLRVQTQEGRKILLGPGGVPRTRGPAPTRIVEADRHREITITVPIDHPEQHEQLLGKVVKDLRVDRSQVSDGVIFLTSTLPGTIQLKFGVGGLAHSRACAKIALNFLALQIGDGAFAERYTGLRAAAFLGTPCRAWLQPVRSEIVAPFAPESDGVQHRVIIYSTVSETWAHVELYGTYGFAVLMAETPDDAFRSPYVWALNPTNGERAEGRLGEAILSAPLREAVSLPREDHEQLFRTMFRRAGDLERRRAINEEVAFLFASLGEGERPTLAAWAVMVTRIEARFAAIADPSCGVDLTLPIRDRTHLAAVRKILAASRPPTEDQRFLRGFDHDHQLLR